MSLVVRQTDNALIINVKVVPRSSSTEIAGVHDGMLKVKVAAVPEKGKANKHLTDYLAEVLGIAKRDVSIVGGLTNPVKTIKITGPGIDALKNKLSRFTDGDN